MRTSSVPPSLGGPRRPWTTFLAAVVLGATTACREPAPVPEEAPVARDEENAMKRVTGIGGVFFETDDPARTLDWYRTHLGIDAADFGAFAFQWTEKDRPDETGYTVWSVFPDSSPYLEPSEQPFMVNYRVADLEGLVAALTAEGVEVVGGIEEHPNGKFAWILDSDGRKIELWEPVPSEEDPFLR